MLYCTDARALAYGVRITVALLSEPARRRRYWSPDAEDPVSDILFVHKKIRNSCTHTVFFFQSLSTWLKTPGYVFK